MMPVVDKWLQQQGFQISVHDRSDFHRKLVFMRAQPGTDDAYCMLTHLPSSKYAPGQGPGLEPSVVKANT